MTRAPRLPLWTGKSVTAADYKAASEALMPERDLQRAVLAELNNPYLCDGPVLAFAIPNSLAGVLPGVPASLKARVWKGFVRDGARAGAADLVIAHKGRVLFLELKRATGGKLSEEQKRFRDDCHLCGAQWKYASGLSEARQVLADFGALRRRT